jgi:serine/threonine protein phosphatase PrpC
MLDGDFSPTETMRFDVATASIQGTRDYQEDAIIANFPVGQGSGFAIIADGMGGQVGGGLASALVTTQMFTHLKLQESLLISGALNAPFSLREAAKQANKSIADHVVKNSTQSGMGSTLLAPVILGDRLSWISVGDSPLYLFRAGALRQLNKDHSMAPQIDVMVKEGAMDAAKGKDHPDRHKLLSVINGKEIAEIDCPKAPVLLKNGDILIAATDGLQALSNTIIAKTLKAGQSGTALELANAFLRAVGMVGNPDQDNTTFAVIKISEEAQADDVMDLDDMPVLAMVEDEVDDVPVVEAAPDESKAYYYRGQKYYRD